MKKAVCFIVLVFIFSQFAQAVSVDLKETYAPRETAIGMFSADVVGSISREQVRLVRNGHVDVGVEYGLGRVGNNNYVWFNSPKDIGNYTLIVEDVIAMVEGIPEVVEYRKDFEVKGAQIDYSVSPGFVVAEEDFTILATVYGSSALQTSTNFPEERALTLLPGVNYVSFDLSEIVGVQVLDIGLGIYSIPAHLIGQDHICGDGQVDGLEVCDEGNLDGEDCSTAGEFVSGTLACSDDCLSFDFSECETSECGSGNPSGCLSEENCTEADNYWYNDSCHEYEEDSVCDDEHRGICETKGTCIDVDGYWYNDYCNDDPEPVYKCGDGIIEGNETCDENNLNNETCESLGYLYGELSCLDSCLFDTGLCVAGSGGPAKFVFTPRFIRDTVVLSDDSRSYKFSIRNDGLDPIRDIRFDYNSDILVLSESNFSLENNETKYFNATFKNSVTRPTKTVVVAYSGEVYEYLLIEVNLTDEEGDAGTIYSNDGSDDSLYHCSEVPGGILCEDDEICTSGISTLDGFCCTGECESSGSSGGIGWVGYLLVGIVILVLIIIYVKYKKTGSGGGSKLASGIKSPRFLFS